MAPTFLVGLVSIIVGAQHLIGLDFASDQWMAFLMVGIGIVAAARQYLTGRSTWLGTRPSDFRG